MVGSSFNISDEAQRGGHPLLRLSLSLSPLLFHFPSHSTLHSIISHFPLQPFSFLFGPIIFLFAALLLLSVSPSFFIWCRIISHLHSISVLAYLFLPLSSSLILILSPFSENCFFSPLSTVCLIPSPCMTALG